MSFGSHDLCDFYGKYLVGVNLGISNNHRVSIIGFAVLLTINATALWGGAFPFLPSEFQTPEILTTFFLLQSVAFSGTFLSAMLFSYYLPNYTQRVLVFMNGVPIFFGSLFLIATLYVPVLTMFFICTGAILLGAGCAGFLLLWQRYFSAQDPQAGNTVIILGTGLAALIYYSLYAIPIGVTALIVPLILVPLCGLALILGTRGINFAQPMFEDTPKQHPDVYLNTIKSYWSSAVAVGGLGFASGIIRSVAISDPSLGTLVNAMAMFGALVSSAVLFYLGRRFSFSFDVVQAFRWMFPFVITSFLLIAVFGTTFMHVFSGALYMVFTFMIMLMMIQCSQASRDMGINPLFIYGFFASIVYFLQSLGFILGNGFEDFSLATSSNTLFVAAGTIWVLALAMYAVRGEMKSTFSHLQARPSRIEFIRHLPRTQSDSGSGDKAMSSVKPFVSESKDAAKDNGYERDEFVVFRDRISKQCATIKEVYQLTARETEVMELIARGTTVSVIAERLIVSENTVRTHSKNLYSKLAIHKRQEMLDLLDTTIP